MVPLFKTLFFLYSLLVLYCNGNDWKMPNTDQIPIAQKDLDKLLQFSKDHPNEIKTHLPFEVDPTCKDNMYFRTADGSCNWAQSGESNLGKAGSAFQRDVPFPTYADGISKPRKGPNPRTLSNVFFSKREKPLYEHTSVLVGLIEFIIHDVALSVNGNEMYNISIPKCDPFFDPKCEGNKFMPFWRAAPLAGTGSSPSNPRQQVNGATTWLDISSMYGSDLDTQKKLRSFVGGKMKTMKGPDGKEYPPLNTLGMKMAGHPPQANLFATGDVRGNQDWLLMAVETLMLREHNRICDLLAADYPTWDDEKLFQVGRLAMSSKFAMIANAYQMGYFTKEMPYPQDDGFPLYREFYHTSVLEINPFHSYPWKPSLYYGKPMVASHEMSIGYRFHEILPTEVSLISENSTQIGKFGIVETAFDAKGFMAAGVDDVLRGMASTMIPNFHSGTDDIYRNMRFNFGDPDELGGFDLVAWTIQHERERGLPTFNQYFRNYKGYPQVKPRTTFEEFTSVPEFQQALKELYGNPEDVDLTVGQYLDETYFPGTTVPRSQLITSLFSLFGLGNADRFSPGYSVLHCLLVQRPWNCTPSNALDELLWEPKPLKEAPNARWWNTKWLVELGINSKGKDLLWRLVTENTDIKCLQANPLFPVDAKTNPIICSRKDLDQYLSKGLSTTNLFEIGGAVSMIIISAAIFLWISSRPPRGAPPVLKGGVPFFGNALKFNSSPVQVLRAGINMAQTFTLKLVSNFYAISNAEDAFTFVRNQSDDSTLSLSESNATLFEAVFGRDVIVDPIVPWVVRQAMPPHIPTLVESAKETTAKYLDKKKWDRQEFATADEFIQDLMETVGARNLVGPDNYDNTELIEALKQFTKKSMDAAGLGQILPSGLKFIASFTVRGIKNTIRSHIMPIIKKRRSSRGDAVAVDFLQFLLDARNSKDERYSEEFVMKAVFEFLFASDVTAAAFAHVLLDIAARPENKERIVEELKVPSKSQNYPFLESCILESFRLSSNPIGVARKVMKPFDIMGNFISKGWVFALSAILTHFDPKTWPDPFAYDPSRFTNKNWDGGDMTEKFLYFGLGFHKCPGRFYAIDIIKAVLSVLLVEYDITLTGPRPEYIYETGLCHSKPVGLVIEKRKK